MLDHAEHICVAHPAETREQLVFGDRIATGGQHLGMGPVDDRFAVDQHAQSKITKSKRRSLIGTGCLFSP
jgi:hypothetical protein